MLHLVFESAIDEAFLGRIGEGDVVLLLDNAVLRPLNKSIYAGVFAELLQKACCCVLNEHLQIFGIDKADLVDGIEVLDYEGMVNLTVAEAVIQTWA